MNTLYEWAIQWGVPYDALHDLQQRMGIISTEPTTVKAGRSEAAVQNQVRLEASKQGARLWRNNRGACYDANGNFIRYGLANDSERMDKVIKSHDLIGITPKRIVAADVGHTVGIFTSYEIKPEGWRYTGTERELAQREWAELILKLGGYSKFINGVGQI